MALHDQLRTLVDTHGASILDQAEGFRAALDDFLTEDEATPGEVNLLVDAVRLGSVERMVALLDQGATPDAAVAEAGAQLARDRDTDPKRAQWALTTLGYALRRMDSTIPAVTMERERPEPVGTPPPEPSGATRPVEPPPAAEAAAATHRVESAPPPAPEPAPRRPRVGVVIGAIVAALLLVGVVVAVVAWPEDDDDGGGSAKDSNPPASEPAGNDDAGGTGDADCPTPRTPPVDPEADESALCLAGQFDQWADGGVMAVGQQVNLDNDAWTDPLTALAPNDVRIVGFDLQELATAAALGKDRVPDLITLAEQGHVLVASWHADNPFTNQPSWDMTDTDKVTELTDPAAGSAAYDAFWADWDEIIATVGRLRDAGVPIILRPLHEANGQWFWWAHQDPAVFKELWTQLRTRVEDAGMHNVLWHFAAAPRTYNEIQDPLALLPEVDFAGLDTYDCEQPGTRAEELECGGGRDYEEDLVDFTSYADLSAAVPRMSLSEVGPQFSFDGSWDPSTVTTTAVENGFRPVYAMFWFDDQREGRPPMAKQLASLEGSKEWLGTCQEALCDVSGG